MLGYAADEVQPRYRGAVLVPWPNRVPDGRWAWRGREHQLAINEPERNAALHGLSLWLDWQPAALGTDHATLRTRLCAQPGYPFGLDLTSRWELGPAGLRLSVQVRNAGGEDAPVGLGFHPYLLGSPDGTADDWTLQLPAGGFAAPQPLRGRQLDDTYDGIAFTGDTATAVVADARGDGALIEFGPSTPWVQVFTTDFPGAADHRRGVAVEPMTCPPGALASGVGLVTLEPGASTEVSWRLAAL